MRRVRTAEGPATGSGQGVADADGDLEVSSKELTSNSTYDDDSSKSIRTDAKRLERSQKATRMLQCVLLLLACLAFLGYNHEAGLKAFGWRRPDRVALLTVASHTTRFTEGADSESEYGSSKTAFSYPFSIDNKARYCALHQYDLNVDLHTSGFTVDGDASSSGDGAGEGADVSSSGGSSSDASWRHATRSSRFRKLQLIREMWDAYDWLVWMDLDALFVDPHTDVLDLLDKSADLHFTLEDASGSGRGPGESRVNTGFFAVRTTPFARDFFERAWAVNDCGRGQSDQRSINYVLGRTNGDDQECTADGAVAEWLALATRHGGHATATSKVRYYKKPLLNAFPRRVDRYLVPVEGYSLPAKEGDEQAVSLVVHFAGQYGGARASDGKLPNGMLVQYLHLLSHYHGAFLDRLAALEANQALALASPHDGGGASGGGGGGGGSALLKGGHVFHPFHDDEHAKRNGLRAGGAGGGAKPLNARVFGGGRLAASSSSSSSSNSGKGGGAASEGPKMLQDAVVDHAHEWARPTHEAKTRVNALEDQLYRECLSKLVHYVEVDEPETGLKYKAPPKLPKPEPKGITQQAYAKQLATNLDPSTGQARVDLSKSCDAIATLSMAKQHLAGLLPPDDSRAHPRWPASLLCAAPASADELASRLNATRRWLELRKPSTLHQLQFGAPFVEDDEFSALHGFDGDSGSGNDHGYGNNGLPLGPSLYGSLDVSAAVLEFEGEEGWGPGSGASFSGVSGGGNTGEHDDHEGDPAHSLDGPDGRGGGALTDTLLLAVAECAFLDPSDGVVLEHTFAYSANPDKWLPQAAKAQSNYHVQVPRRSAGSGDGTHQVPGALYLPPLAPEAAKQLMRWASGSKNYGQLDDDDDDDNDPSIVGGAPEAVVDQHGAAGAELLGFWTYTAPLLVVLMQHVPAHVRIVLPPHSDLEQLADALTLLHVPLNRVLVSSSPPPSVPAVPPPASSFDQPTTLESYRAAAAKLKGASAPSSSSSAASSSGSTVVAGLTVLNPGSVVYADMLISVHAAMRMSIAASQQLHQLRPAVAPHGLDQHRDPTDDLVVCLEEKPLDASSSSSSDSASGAAASGTRVADWSSLRAALSAALPSDLVVSHSSFDPDSHAARELFKRAKLIVVPAGVVPSLLLAMFSSEGTPVLELVGSSSSSDAQDHSSGSGGANSGSSNHAGGPASGWAWTKQASMGLGLDRHPVHATGADHRGRSLFDPEAVAAAAYRAMNYEAPDEEEAEEEGGQDMDDRNRAGGDDASFRDEVDDFGSRGQEEPEEGEGESEGRVFGTGELSPESRALIEEYGVPSQRVEVGLWDRDQLGELLQRLGNEAAAAAAAAGGTPEEVKQTYATKGGAMLGVEFGDFAQQVLQRWVRCPKFTVLDRFAAPPAPPSGSTVGKGSEADAVAVDQLHSLDQSAQAARLKKVQDVLGPWLGASGSGTGGARAGVISAVAPIAETSVAAAATNTLADNSLSFAYLDGDHDAESVGKELAALWPKLAPGGMLAGHDFTRAHAGVAAAVLHFARHAATATMGHGSVRSDVTLFVTDVQKPRLDVRGLELPPCCPSWYLFKPLADGASSSMPMDSIAQRIADELNRS